MAPVAKDKKTKTLKEDISPKKVVSAQLQKKIAKQEKRSKRNNRGVVLIRHLPKGFFEEQIKQYFEQFGNVTRVRLARSRRTGGSKSFAFIEFQVPEVAQIAAETMDNYLMFQKLVKAHYIPPEQQKFNYFRTGVRRVVNSHGKAIYSSYKIVNKNKSVKNHNRWNNDTYSERMTKALRKLTKLKDKYSDLDLNFDSIVIKPKLAIPENDTLEDAEDANSSRDEDEKPGSLLLIKKRKLSNESNENNENQKKKKEALSLKHLLEDTINSDSSADEDYLPIEDYNPNETLEIPPNTVIKTPLSKELTKTLQELKSDSDSDVSFKPSDDNDVSDDEEDEDSENLEHESGTDEETDEDDENDDEESDLDNDQEDATNTFKISKTSKFDKENRFDKMIRRKPHSGGITKKTLKPKNEKKINNTKSIQLGKMKAVIANEMIKDKNLKKSKTTDLKMKKKVK